MIKAHTVTRYLERHAQPCARVLLALLEAGSFSPRRYQSAVVVPVFAEDAAQLIQLFSAAIDPQTPRLAICVVNQPPDAEAALRAKNQQFVQAMLERASRTTQVVEHRVHLLSGVWPKHPALDLLLIDVTAGPWALTDKEGVGRARKVAADWALGMHEAGKLHSCWVGSSDADAQLPANYFEFLERSYDASALVFPFEHRALPGTEPHLIEGMAQVEATFRYYVLGLQFAGSPYSYHSLGSALAFSLPHYAAVRGFPNRQAGEDFYLLSKLVQLRPIVRIDNQPIIITTRLSDRIPFGTGPRLAQWVNETTLLEGAYSDQAARRASRPRIMTWHPDLFVALRTLLTLLKAWAADGHAPPLSASNWVEEEARQIFAAVQSSLQACPSARHRERRLHEQLDALFTLRWLNRQTRQRFPLLPLDDALRRAVWLGLGPEEAGDHTLDALAGLRRIESLLDPLVGPQLASLSGVHLGLRARVE